jgi:hypothetical protein
MLIHVISINVVKYTELKGLPEDLKNWISEEKNQGTEVLTYPLTVDYKDYSQGKSKAKLSISQSNS